MASVALGLALSPASGKAVVVGAVAVALLLGPAASAVNAAASRRHARAASPTARAALLPLVAGCALLVLGGGIAGQARLASIDATAARVHDGEPLGARVVALGRPRPGAFGSSVEVGVRGGALDGARLLVRIPRWGHWPAGLAIGDELNVRGELRRLRTSGRGADFDAYLRRRGVAGELLLDHARATGGRRGGAAGAVDSMRRRAEQAIEAGLPGPDADLLRGMVLGEDEAIAEPVRDSFRASGLAHLLAVSGQNVMLLAALALPALALAGVGIRARCAALLALICVYVPLAGAGPSLQRAGVMGAAGAVALASSRPASRSYALLLAAAATLALNPRAAGDAGWQLSFAAVAAIVWLVPPLQAVLRRAVDGAFARERPPAMLQPAASAAPPQQELAARRSAHALGRRALYGLADGAALALVATLATAPLLAHTFGYAPIAGLPANLLALPAVAPAMWLGMLEAAVGQLTGLPPPFGAGGHALAAALGALARPAVAYIAWVADRFAELPGGQPKLPLRSPFALGASYALLGGAVAVARRTARRAGPRAEAALAAWRRKPVATKAAAAAASAALALLAAAWALAPPGPPSHLTVRFLDVGQGDATLIQDPAGTNLLFDGGPPEAHTVAELRAAGVRRLALVAATHQSRDHQGGLPAVLERFPVALLLENADGTRDPGFLRVLSSADKRGIRRVKAVAPMTLRAGGFTIRVLSPPPRPPGPPPEDPNPRGVVAIVSEGGFDLFLSADAESEALLPLRLPRVDAMKVPHHGSSDPGLPEVLRRLRPRVAGIEVGLHNTYGHPAPSTLRALANAHVRTYRTDRDGAVTLTVGPQGLAVSRGH
jgi:competence protein ComEC